MNILQEIKRNMLWLMSAHKPIVRENLEEAIMNNIKKLEQNVITITCPDCDGSGFNCDRKCPDDMECETPECHCKTCNGSGTVKALISKED
jgi:DnaJ-class molecular chaperone